MSQVLHVWIWNVLQIVYRIMNIIAAHVYRKSASMICQYYLGVYVGKND